MTFIIVLKYLLSPKCMYTFEPHRDTVSSKNPTELTDYHIKSFKTPLHAHNYYHNYYCRCLQKRNIPFLLPFFSSIIYWSATCKLCIPSLWVNNKTFIQLNKIRMQRLVEIIKKTLYWGTTLYNIRYKIKYVLLSINYKQDEQGLWYQVPKYYFFCLHIPLRSMSPLWTIDDKYSPNFLYEEEMLLFLFIVHVVGEIW